MTRSAAIGCRIAALVVDAEHLAGEMRQLATAGELRTHALIARAIARDARGRTSHAGANTTPAPAGNSP